MKITEQNEQHMVIAQGLGWWLWVAGLGAAAVILHYTVRDYHWSILVAGFAALNLLLGLIRSYDKVVIDKATQTIMVRKRRFFLILFRHRFELSDVVRVGISSDYHNNNVLDSLIGWFTDILDYFSFVDFLRLDECVDISLRDAIITIARTWDDRKKRDVAEQIGRFIGKPLLGGAELNGQSREQIAARWKRRRDEDADDRWKPRY